MKKFKLITAAGTFDRLHQGHEFFLKGAFVVSQHVLLGITSDRYIKNKPLGFIIESYKKRALAVAKFLEKKRLLLRATIVKLDDIYGPTVDKDSKIQGILVTPKTIRGARLINKKRKILKLPPLEIIKIPLLGDKYGKEISSINIRKIDILNNNLTLPKIARPHLQQPQGKLLKGRELDHTIAALKARKLIKKTRPPLVVTIGDVVTHSFNQVGLSISLAIVDFRIKRKKAVKNLWALGFKKEKPDMVVRNPSGTVSSSLSLGIKKIIEKANSKPLIIKVLGEEDLAVLPAIVLSPRGTAIFYGQPPHHALRGRPEEGIVYIGVDEEVKTRTLHLLSQFKTSTQNT